MRKRELSSKWQRLFGICLCVVAVFIFAGVLISFRSAGSLFRGATKTISTVTTQDAEFVRCYKDAIKSDLIFCILVVCLSSGFPVSVLSMLLILTKSFLIGVSAGLTARCFEPNEAWKILFAIFVSNALVLPLYILLFLLALNFSIKATQTSLYDRTKGYLMFVFKASLVFAIMCVLELVQVGIGVLVL